MRTGQWGLVLLLLILWLPSAPAEVQPQIMIDSSPAGARVEIDGVHQGDTGPDFKLRIAKGKHHLRLTLSGYKPVDQLFRCTGPAKLRFVLNKDSDGATAPVKEAGVAAPSALPAAPAADPETAVADAEKFAEARVTFDKFHDCPAAIAALQGVSDAGRTNPFWNYYVAQSYECIKDYEQAIHYYSIYGQLTPGQPEIINKIGELRYLLKKSIAASIEERKKHEAEVLAKRASLLGKWQLSTDIDWFPVSEVEIINDPKDESKYRINVVNGSPPYEKGFLLAEGSYPVEPGKRFVGFLKARLWGSLTMQRICPNFRKGFSWASISMAMNKEATELTTTEVVRLPGEPPISQSEEQDCAPIKGKPANFTFRRPLIE